MGRSDYPLNTMTFGYGENDNSNSEISPNNTNEK